MLLVFDHVTDIVTAALRPRRPSQRLIPFQICIPRSQVLASTRSSTTVITLAVRRRRRLLLLHSSCSSLSPRRSRLNHNPACTCPIAKPSCITSAASALPRYPVRRRTTCSPQVPRRIVVGGCAPSQFLFRLLLRSPVLPLPRTRCTYMNLTFAPNIHE